MRPGIIHTGDLLLWGANTVVLFYETFSSSYSYTRLGKIENPAGGRRTWQRKREGCPLLPK
ncbi:cyclophilin-like fold protein [uncultured Parabacteroides sp.]|uniref:cyclophilin-like fold protein n=1 Tax=uncultured Parabacteroides sp. TaxID=512312 RepID=UPI00338E6980